MGSAVQTQVFFVLLKQQMSHSEKKLTLSQHLCQSFYARDVTLVSMYLCLNRIKDMVSLPGIKKAVRNETAIQVLILNTHLKGYLITLLSSLFHKSSVTNYFS